MVLGAIWVADKAYAAYEAYQDVQDIRSGKKTVGEVAAERATEHAAGAVAGAVGRLGVKASKMLLRHSDEIVDLTRRAAKT